MADYETQVQHIDLRGYPLKVIGNLDNLRQNLLGVFCSQKCPGDLVLKGFDTVRQIRDQGITVVSGFHSSMEKDVYEILLRGNQPIVHCLARAIETYRIPSRLNSRINRGQLTIIAPYFPENMKRMTKSTSERSNALIMDISDQVLIIHAQKGGSLFKLISSMTSLTGKVFVLESENNRDLLGLIPEPSANLFHLKMNQARISGT